MTLWINCVYLCRNIKHSHAPYKSRQIVVHFTEQEKTKTSTKLIDEK